MDVLLVACRFGTSSPLPFPSRSLRASPSRAGHHDGPRAPKQIAQVCAHDAHRHLLLPPPGNSLQSSTVQTCVANHAVICDFGKSFVVNFMPI